MTESEQLAEIKSLIEQNNQRVDKRLEHLEPKTEDISKQIREEYNRSLLYVLLWKS